MKIMLILAASDTDPLKKNDPFMPLSLPLLAASAPEHDYIFVDMLAGEVPDFNTDAGVIGISYRISAESKAFELAGIFKSKGKTVIMGGAQASVSPYEAKNVCDSVVIGEGEFVWPRVLKDYENKRLHDFYISSPIKFDNKAGFKVYQADRYPDLSNVKKGLRHYYKKKYVFDTVFATRGCPINCDFCSVTPIFGSKVRTRPVDDVVSEISTFKGYYYLLDDNVFGRPAQYDYYLELYSKIASLKKINLWTGQANLDAASTEKGRDVIRAAARAGLIYAAIGMESINKSVLEKSGTIKKMGTKGNDVIREMEDNIRFIQDQGIVISGWFTLGYEDDTIDTFEDTLEFCIKNNIIPALNPLEALPGTRLYDRLEKEDRISKTSKINIIHKDLSPEDILNAIKEANYRAFSFKERLNRTLFYKEKFARGSKFTRKSVYNTIYKTIFTHVLQKKLKKGLFQLANEDK